MKLLKVFSTVRFPQWALFFVWGFFAPLFLTSSGCLPTTSMPPIGKVTRIEVSNNMGSSLKKISDQARIGRVVTFIDRHAAGWGGLGDWGGVPVPRITVNLYDGTTFKGHFGVGSNFFETQRQGDFMSQSAPAEEIAEFCRLLGISEDLIPD